MKKLLLVFFLSLLIYLSCCSFSFASTIYSNSLTSSLSDFTQFWGPCSTSSIGINPNCHGGLLYTVGGYDPLPTIKCVQADYDLSVSNNSGLWISESSNFTWIYALGIFTNGTFLTQRQSNPITSVWDVYTTNTPIPTGIHTYNTCTDGTNAYFFEDGVQLFSHPLTFPTTFAGFGINADASSFANLVVTDSLPSSPSPTPTPIQLPVPLVKQTGPWKGATYDLATIWSPTNYSIGTWGCALTSATMVLQYYQIYNLPGNGNLVLTPGTLDAWLGVQPDGYIPNGNVNWLAISRLTKQAKTNNSNFLFDALEYQRSNFADTTTLLADLTSNHPDILEEPGHFVVATGKNSGDIFTINDPYYNRTLLSDYGNTFSSLGRYIPSLTDLSYMLFTSDPSLTVTVKDSTNTPVGTNYVQQPLSGAGTTLTAGNPINLLYLQQPGNGTYTLTISGSASQLYTIKGFLYDINGNVKPFTQMGTVDPNNPNIVTLHFDGQDLSNDTTQKIVTISSFLSDVSDLYKLGYLKKGAYEPLKNLGENAQKAMKKHNILLVKINLGVIKTLLGVDKGVNLLTDTAYQILLADIQYLQTH